MINDSIEQLRAALKMPGFTKRALAKRAGIHHNTLLGCEGEDWNPTLTTLRAIDAHLPSAQQIVAGMLPDWVMPPAAECQGGDACASVGDCGAGAGSDHISSITPQSAPLSTGHAGEMSPDANEKGIAA